MGCCDLQVGLCNCLLLLTYCKIWGFILGQTQDRVYDKGEVCENLSFSPRSALSASWPLAIGPQILGLSRPFPDPSTSSDAARVRPHPRQGGISPVTASPSSFCRRFFDRNLRPSGRASGRLAPQSKWRKLAGPSRNLGIGYYSIHQYTINILCK